MFQCGTVRKVFATALKEAESWHKESETHSNGMHLPPLHPPSSTSSSSTSSPSRSSSSSLLGFLFTFFVFSQIFLELFDEVQIKQDEAHLHLPSAVQQCTPVHKTFPVHSSGTLVALSVQQTPQTALQLQSSCRPRFSLKFSLPDKIFYCHSDIQPQDRGVV